MFEMHYTGAGYPDMREIELDAKQRGFTHSYWASELGYAGLYNGDTVVVYTAAEDLPEGYRQDALKYGRPIE